MLPTILHVITLSLFAHTITGSAIYPSGNSIDSVPFNSYASSVIGNTYSVRVLKINPCIDDIPDLGDSIPLVTYRGCEYDQFFAKLVAANPPAILFTMGGVKLAGWFTSSQEVIDSVQHPIYEISGYYVRNITDNTTITIEPTDNTFVEFFHSPGAIIFNIIIGLTALTGFILAIHKFVLYCRFRPFTSKSLPHINLLILLGFFVLVITWLIDPLYARRYYTFLQSEMLMTIATPLLMVSCCFIALFWLQVVNKVMVTAAWKGKYYYLCIGISITISVLTVILGILKSIRLIEIFAVQLVIFAFFIGVAITYIIAGIKLLKSLTRSSKMKASKVDNYKRVAAGFILCSLSSIGYIASGLGTLVGSFGPRPSYASVIPTMFVNFFAILLAFFQVIFLKTPTSEVSTSLESKSKGRMSRQHSISKLDNVLVSSPKASSNV